MTNQPPQHHNPDEINTAEVDRLVRDGAPLSHIYPHFPTRSQAMTYYASSKCMQHGLADATSDCCLCHNPHHSPPLEFRWVAGNVSFSTYHPICPACVQHLRRRQLLGAALHAPGLLAVVGGPILLAYTLLVNPRITTPPLVVAAVLVIAGELFLWARRHLRVPSALRKIVPKPFDCIAICPPRPQS